MNMMRRIRRLNEESYWAPLDQRDRIHKMSKAGTLARARRTSVPGGTSS